MNKMTKELLAPLANTTWRCDEYALNYFAQSVERHALRDQQSGLTSRHILRDGRDDEKLTKSEMDDIIKSGVVPDNFYTKESADTVSVNQHYLHSLEQFYAHCQAEWERHLCRTNDLIGTPAGRIKGAHNA